jgi:hypothetical protein
MAQTAAMKAAAEAVRLNHGVGGMRSVLEKSL